MRPHFSKPYSSLVVFVWIIPVLYSFHPIHRRRSPNLDHRSSQRLFAFPWPAGKKEKNETAVVPTPSEIDISENLSDAANIMESFKTSQRIGEGTGATLRELSGVIVEGVAADGKVKVRFNGQQIPTGVEVDETYLKDIVSQKGSEGVNELCAALTDAMQDAHYKSGMKVEEKLKSMYSDLGFESD